MEERPVGKVAGSENYSLRRARTGTSFGVLASPTSRYEVNATIGYPFPDEISSPNNYRILYTISSDLVTPP